jgi:hypothetical protein
MKKAGKNLLITTLALLLCALLSPIILAQTPDETPAPDFFIKAEVNNTNPYLGQQVTYLVKRYQAVSFPNPPYYEDQLINGFWSVPLIQRPSYTETIAGRVYQVHPTHMAFFPTKPGPLTIPPTRLVIPMNRPEADLILESEGFQLEARSLPEGAPSDFSGAVGQFEIEAKLGATEGWVNEILTLTVEIGGSGNIETLSAPPLPQLQYWRFFDEKVTTEIPLSPEIVKGVRRFQWSVVPGRAGEQEIPPLSFTYYDLEAGSYRTITSSPLPVTILPALEGEDNPAFPQSLEENERQQVVKVASDIRHIKSVPEVFRDQGSYTMRSFFYGLGLIIPVLLVGASWLWQRWRKLYGGDTPLARRRQAREKARQILREASQPSANPYALAYRSLTLYLSDRLDQPIAGMTSDQLSSLLHQARLNPDLARRFQSQLTQAELHRFAPPLNPQDDPPAFIAETQKLLDDLEFFFRRRLRN